MYDCKADVLLQLKDPQPWVYTAALGEFNIEGLVILWALLHHRLFLKKVVAEKTRSLRSGLAGIFERNATLNEFKRLKDVNIVSFGSTRQVCDNLGIARASDKIFSPCKKHKSGDNPGDACT